MSAILLQLTHSAPASPVDFARACGDFQFNGAASGNEMRDFWLMAHKCMQRSSKSLERIGAVWSMGKFLEMPASTFFPHLDVKIVTYQMIIRLMKPERVNQMTFGICGPAHFVVLWIKSKPRNYVSMAYELLTAGKATTDSGSPIVPNKFVREFNPAGSIPEADWLFAASLRNADGPIPEGTDRGSYSGTQNPEIFNYCLEAGYTEVVSVMCYQRLADSFASLFAPSFYANFHPIGLREVVERMCGGGKFSDPAVNFTVACTLRSLGFRVLLQINSGLLTFEPATDKQRERAKSGKYADVAPVKDNDEQWKSIVSEKTVFGPIVGQNFNHWVLAKNIAVEGESVRLGVYTWGTRKEVAYTLYMKDFANAYGGFVAARG